MFVGRGFIIMVTRVLFGVWFLFRKKNVYCFFDFIFIIFILFFEFLFCMLPFETKTKESISNVLR